MPAPMDFRAPFEHRRAVFIELCRVMDKRHTGYVTENDLRSALPLAGFRITSDEIMAAYSAYGKPQTGQKYDYQRFASCLGGGNKENVSNAREYRPSSPRRSGSEPRRRPQSASAASRSLTRGDQMMTSTIPHPPARARPTSASMSRSSTSPMVREGWGEETMQRPMSRQRPMSARSDESGARHKFFDEFGVAVHAAEVQPTVIDDHAKFLLSRLKQKLKQRLKGGPGEVRRTFSYLDKSKTGKVDREDLRHVFHDIGIVLEKKDELALMQFFDRSKTGDISLDEFVAWFESSDDRPVSAAKFNSADARENRQAHAQNIRDKIASGGQLGMQMIAAVRDKVHSRIATGPYQLRRAFKHFDRDGSGSISVHEFTHVMRNFGFNLSKKEIAVLFNLFDLNGDGSLDYYEFIDIVLPQDYDAAEHPLGRAIARQPGPWSMELVREGEFLPRKLQDRTSNVYQRFGKAIAAYDPNRTGIVSVTDFVDAIKRMEWAYWGEDEQQEIIKKLVDDNGQVHYAAFLDALEKDTFMTQPISKFLRPKQMRSNADIFQNRGAGVAESRPAKRISAPEVQPPLDRAGWDEIEQSKNFGISAKEMVQRTNPLVIPSMLGAPKRFVFGPLPSDIQPEFAYGIQNGPSDNITDVVSNAFGRQALVHARLREAIEVDRRNKKFRPPGGHTRSSLLRASAIQNKMKTQNARRLRDAAAAVNGQGVSALEQAALGW